MGRKVKTMGEVGELLGTDRRTVGEWIKASGILKGEDGWDVDEIATWRETNMNAKLPTGDGATPGSMAERMQQAKLKKLENEAIEAEAKARIRVHEADKQTENIVHLDDVERFLSGVFSEARRVFKRIPKEMSSGYPADLRQSLESDIDARIDIALRTLSGFCRRVTDLREE